MKKTMKRLLVAYSIFSVAVLARVIWIEIDMPRAVRREMENRS
jgi:hypothetical protein